MAIEIFNRQELKFVVTKQQYAAIMPQLLEHMRLDKHNRGGTPYGIYNLYVDTSDFALIRHSTAKPVYKEKIRIRSYAPLRDDSMVFLEIKKRYRKITNKRRTSMQLADALEFIRTAHVTPRAGMNMQVVRECSTMLAQQQYYPTTYISYDRVALHDRNDASDLRVTFDMNLTSRGYNQPTSHSLLAADKLIMEIKSAANMPLWLAQLLREYGIRKQGFSKYGIEYARLLRSKHSQETQYAR